MPDNTDSGLPADGGADDSLTVFDKDIGDDWGEAFEADELMLSSEEDTNADFFLEEEDFEEALPGQEAADSEIDEEGVGVADSPLLLKISALYVTVKDRVLALPPALRIPTLSVPLLLVFLLLYFFPSFHETKQLPVAPVEQSQAEAEDKENPLLAEDEAAIKGKTRKKLAFPSFLISTSGDVKGDDIFFVEIEVALVLFLGEKEELQYEQEVFVRDNIYQFFNNRPLYELRRYSLARGEMTRKLRFWLEKQWPDGDIASIVFYRYQVL